MIIPEKSNKIGNFTVEPEDERPARSDGTCFYCAEPIGGRHRPGCIIPDRVARVRITFEIDLAVPECFDDKDVECRFEEGSASHYLPGILLDYAEVHGCLCELGMKASVVE